MAESEAGDVWVTPLDAEGRPVGPSKRVDGEVTWWSNEFSSSVSKVAAISEEGGSVVEMSNSADQTGYARQAVGWWDGGGPSVQFPETAGGLASIEGYAIVDASDDGPAYQEYRCVSVTDLRRILALIDGLVPLAAYVQLSDEDAEVVNRLRQATRG